MQIVLIKKPNQKKIPKHARFVWACFTFNLRDEKWLMMVESFWGDQIDAEKTQGSSVQVLGFRSDETQMLVESGIVTQLS